jgi:hypothetical protein
MSEGAGNEIEDEEENEDEDDFKWSGLRGKL